MGHTTCQHQYNFLGNKNILAEIALSKGSYCEFDDPRFADYDLILPSLDGLNENHFQGRPEIVVRVPTWEHIPGLAEGEKHRRRTAPDRTALPFPPFKHYLCRQDAAPVEVGRSHWRDGQFCKDHGRPTDALGLIWWQMVDRHSKRGNWRNYSYRDEMEGRALLQLASEGLQFDESKSQNPFAFYWTTIDRCFKAILQTEKKVQNLRDDLLESMGAPPSYTRQTAWQFCDMTD